VDGVLDDFAALERPRIEAALGQAVERLEGPLGAAAAYAVGAGGKRVRPLLVVAAFRAAGGGYGDDDGPAAIHHVGAALELLHTYSLLHDDLPSMDDDDLRRGLPTAHRVYGVEVATATGVALQHLAFLSLLAAVRSDERLRPVLPSLTARLARGAGIEGMVGGQYLDLAAEGNGSDGASLEAIHRAKTAALISSGCAMGGLAAAAPDRVDALARYGAHLGLAFQIVDDLLDETGDAGRMGKAAGVDRARGKATYPAVHGVDRARELAGEEADAALEALAALPPSEGREVLAAFVRFVLHRLH